MIVVVKAFHGRFLDGPVCPFDLAVRPRVLDLGEPVVDLMFLAVPLKDVFEGMNMPFVIGELDAIVRQHDVEPLGARRRSDCVRQGCGGHFSGLLVQFHESELEGALDCDKEIPLALSRLNRKQYQRESSQAGRP